MELVAVLLILYFTLTWILLGAYLIYSFLFSTPFYPSKISAIEKAFDDLGVIVNSNIKLVDIGSGDGRVILWANSLGAHADGIEMNPFLSLLTRMKVLLKKRENIKILQRDYRNHDFSEYDIVYVYLFNEHMNVLSKKLFNELRPGSLIVSNTFTFSDREADKSSNNFHLYRV